MEKAVDLMELLPGDWRSQRFTKLLLIPGTEICVLEEITPVDQALWPIVIGHSKNGIANTLQPKQGIRPAGRIVRRRIIAKQ